MEAKICQSCGMPMTKAEEFGTEANGTANEEYCVYCYKDGAFTDSGTLQEMIDSCVPFLVKDGMEEGAARAMLQEQMPKLKRWKSA